MLRRLMILLFILTMAIGGVMPLHAAEELPPPFCGDLDEEDCDLLHESAEAMLSLESYSTEIAYILYQQGIPELPADSEAALRIAGSYSFDDAARSALRTFAIISRADPVEAVAAISETPTLLTDLYGGMQADLSLTLDLSSSWLKTIEEESDMEWPAETTVIVRLVDGVLYLNISELKPLISDLEDEQDWVAFEIVAAIQSLIDEGTIQALAADVAASTEGRSVWGMDPTMLNLITTMRATFGRPEVLWPYMEIERRRDVVLDDGQDGAFFETEFDTLDFILSDDFRDVMTQVLQVAAASDGESMTAQEINEIAGLFWFLAPSLFRDLEVSGTSTIGVDDAYQHEGRTIFDWDLTALVQMIASFDPEIGSTLADEIFITFTTEFTNSAFNEPVTVTAPEDAEILPFEEFEDFN